MDLHIIMESINTDKEFIDNLGKDLYYFFKFTIITNNTNLIPSKLQNKKSSFLEETPKNIYEGNIQFDISYNPLIEKEYSNLDLYYLFHGSSSSNWYGILRNGIKNCSGTSLMANGAVHGSGVYLSDSLNFSKAYSTRFNKNHELLIIGVCQIKTNYTKYYKSPNIYTIDNDSELLLRHIIIVNNSANLSEIEKYYKVDLPSEYSFANKNKYKINNKRLTKEMEYFEKFKNKLDNTKILDININSSIEPILHLSIDILMNINNTPQNVIIKFIFRDFPINPPIIYLDNISVESHNFLDKQIYIDNEIIPKSWNIKKKLINYLENIITHITSNNIKNIKSNFDIIINKYDNYISKNNLHII